MRRPGSPLVDARTAYLIVGAAALLVYLNALGNRFAFDDVLIVQTNTAVQTWDGLLASLREPYWPGEHGRALGLWRPLTTGLLGLQWIVGGGSAFVFHATNVALHVAGSLLVVALLLRLVSLPAAFVAGLIFAVHPVHTEAVAGVVGFAELLSGAAVLAACLIHVRGGARSTWGAAVAIAVLYAVGFGAKESAVTLPGLLFLLDAARERLGWRELPAYVAARWRVYAALAPVAAALLAGRWAVLGSIADPLAPMGADLLHEIPRIWTLGEIWLHYVRLWVFPLDLSADYSPNVIPVSLGWGAANTVGAILALLILGATFLTWRRPELRPGAVSARTAAFGVLWFVIAISPISNFVFLSGVLLAERTLYLPSVGLAAATGWLVVRLARERPRVAWLGLAVVVSLAGVRTWTRNPMWYNNPIMFARMISDYPHSGRSQWILGDAQIMQGRLSDGLRSYRAAIDLLDAHYPLITEISARLMQNGFYDPAERIARLAALDSPELVRAWRLLALIRAEKGDPVGTERYARESLAIEHNDPTRHGLLAWALAAQGRLDEARDAYAVATEQGRGLFWQWHLYDAYVGRAANDPEAVRTALDSAWAWVASDLGRTVLDSVIVSEFGLESRLGGSDGGAAGR